MNDKTEPMTLDAFSDLADRYGADVAAWPAHDRAAARALLAAEPAAAKALEEATQLDRLLDTIPTPGASTNLEARVAALMQRPSDAHWFWVLIARPVWRPMVFATAMLGGIYLGAAALPSALATDSGLDLSSVAGGDIGYVGLLEE